MNLQNLAFRLVDVWMDFLLILWVIIVAAYVAFSIAWRMGKVKITFTNKGDKDNEDD